MLTQQSPTRSSRAPSAQSATEFSEVYKSGFGFQGLGFRRKNLETPKAKCGVLIVLPRLQREEDGQRDGVVQ